MVTIGDRVIELRKQQAMTQTKLAEVSGVSISTIKSAGVTQLVECLLPKQKR